MMLYRTTCGRGHVTLTATGMYLCPCGGWATASPADMARVDHALAMANVRRLRTLAIPTAAIHANIRLALVRAAEARTRLTTILGEGH